MKLFQIRTVAPAIITLLLFAACSKRQSEVTQTEQFVQIEGIRYPTIRVEGRTWTAENYSGPGGVPYDSAGTRPEYGKFYTFNEMKAIKLPSGWRVPTRNDFKHLAEMQGIVITNDRANNQETSKKLISVTRWTRVKGNNQSGFNAYPAGYIFANMSPMEGEMSEFWTAEGYSFSIQSGVGTDLRLLFYNSLLDEGYRFNVRFVKDN